MYKRMLVPLDGSELAEIVLPYAKELAGRLDLELVLLHVCEQHGAESQFMCQSYVDHTAETVKAQSREVQIKTGAPQGGETVEVTPATVTGHPAEEIINYANSNNIDIILLASHGRSGVSRWVLGSVADKVLRASRVPIWLVRAAIPEKIVYDEWPKKSYLVLLDGSKTAETVLPHVEALAKQRSAGLMNIVLLRVVEEPFITADYPEANWKEHVKNIKEHFKNEAESYLAGVRQRLAAVGLKVTMKVLMGKPADEIIDYAYKNHPNLIIMATHGNSLASRWEYGNVADKVLYGVSSPVFVVRPQ
jgi:nucleotide-binding universal stress UspA family protein